MKLHTLTPHESRMSPIDFEVQRSMSWGMVSCIFFRTIPDPVIHLRSWNYLHMLPMSQCALLLILGSKGQSHGELMMENGFRTITDPVIHLWSWNFMHLLLISQGCALLISGSKGQDHRAAVIENGFRTITDSVIHLWPETSNTCSLWVKDVPLIVFFFLYFIFFNIF